MVHMLIQEKPQPSVPMLLSQCWKYLSSSLLTRDTDLQWSTDWPEVQYSVARLLWGTLNTFQVCGQTTWSPLLEQITFLLSLFGKLKCSCSIVILWLFLIAHYKQSFMHFWTLDIECPSHDVLAYSCKIQWFFRCYLC